MRLPARLRVLLAIMAKSAIVRGVAVVSHIADGNLVCRQSAFPRYDLATCCTLCWLAPGFEPREWRNKIRDALLTGLTKLI
jgi:hypothetical protein